MMYLYDLFVFVRIKCFVQRELIGTSIDRFTEIFVSIIFSNKVQYYGEMFLFKVLQLFTLIHSDVLFLCRYFTESLCVTGKEAH